jgi:hypothetical protein
MKNVFRHLGLVLVWLGATTGLHAGDLDAVIVPRTNTILAGDSLAIRLDITNTATHAVAYYEPVIRPPFATTIQAQIKYPRSRFYSVIDGLGATQWISKTSVTDFMSGSFLSFSSKAWLNPIYRTADYQPPVIRTISPNSSQSFDLTLDLGAGDDGDPTFLFVEPGEYSLKLIVSAYPVPTIAFAAPTAVTEEWIETCPATVTVK